MLSEVVNLTKTELKDRLREALEARGLRAVDIVDRTGIPKVTISYYLSGKTTPRSDKLYLIAQALDVSEAWLLGYDVPMARTDDQKRNDQLAKLIVKLRTDENFYNTVLKLSNLTENQYKGFEQLIAAFDE
jgi:transcriptional regulator with XRE-family HTH domain